MGWPLPELYARPYLDFIHPEDRAKVAAFAERLAHLPPGESLQIETRARRRDGVYRWLRCSAAVAGGAEPMVYLSGTDVTDLHEALEQLARRSDELERSNAELEAFAGVVSHDLRSSLTAVTGFLALLERRHGARARRRGARAAGVGRRGERAHALARGGPARLRARGSLRPRARARRRGCARTPRGASTWRPARASRRSRCRWCARCRASSSSCWRTWSATRRSSSRRACGRRSGSRACARTAAGGSSWPTTGSASTPPLGRADLRDVPAPARRRRVSRHRHRPGDRGQDRRWRRRADRGPAARGRGLRCSRFTWPD